MSKLTRALAELAKRAAAGDEVARKGIRAYHGSPHDFPPVRELEMPDGAVVYQSMDDAVPEGARVIAEHPLGRFDMSKLGTGEGNQMYGNGLYFAEAEAVAKGYRQRSGVQSGFGNYAITDSVARNIRKRMTEADESGNYLAAGAIDELLTGDFSPDQIRRTLQEDLDVEGLDPTATLKLFDDAVQEARSFKGSMYQVDINATPDEFLDWDKPLSEQPNILEKLRSYVDAKKAEKGGYIYLTDDYTQSLYEMLKYPEDVKGFEVYSDFQDRTKGSFQGAESKSSKATSIIADAGIKGIKYLDEGSRAAGKGTSNYVVFDDRLITISKKYGISIPAAAAVLAGTMTPEEAQAGPLSAGARRIIDPRFSQPVAGGSERKAVRGALETMQTDIDPRLMDVGSPVTLQDYEGYPYMLTQSDRSAAGGMLTGIHGQSIDPVNLQGGRDFMFDPQSGNLVWASDPNVVKTMYKRAMELRKKFGKDPILLPYTMAPTGIDFARMPLDTMINYARQGMSKANIKKLDSQIKKVIPGWTSVMDPEVNAMFRNVGGNQRKIIANIIDKNFRDVPGGLSMGEARAATSDIAQYTSQDGSLLNVGRIDTSQAPIADSGHSTYKGGLVGEGIGRLTEDLDVRPFMAARGRELTGGPEDIRSLSMNPAFSQGVVDEKLLRNIYDTQSGRLQEIATKYGVSIPVAAMALMGDAEEASASDIQANQGLVPFDKDIHTPRDVGFGGPSTEYTMTVDAPDGQVAVIPSIWWDTNGEPVVLDQRDAERRSFEYEQETGKQFPRFPAGGYELADEYAQARTRQGGASESPLASEYPSLGGMGVRMPPTAEDEEAMLAPTGGDLMQQANRDFVDSIRTQPEPDFLTGVQQQLLSGIMKTAGVADLSADVVSAMAGPLLSAPGAIARYAADRYVPGVNYSAEEMAQGRRETEDYFNYQPRTEQGPQYGEQIMQGIGGAIAPYVPAIKKAAGDSYILGAMRQGYDYLGEREKELAKALMDLSPI
jgi:hypothetical protein